MSGLDPQHFYDFDLAKGVVTARGESRVAIIPDTLMRQLVSAANKSDEIAGMRAFGRVLGESANTDISAASADVLGGLAGVWALAGLGILRAETWGPALALRAVDCPIDGKALAALLSGLVSAASAQEVVCVAVGPDNDHLVLEASAAQAVEKWAMQGDSIGVAVGKLGAEGP